MDATTFDKLIVKPENTKTFFEILEKDSNIYILEYYKRMFDENTDVDKVYEYFYKNSAERELKRREMKKEQQV